MKNLWMDILEYLKKRLNQQSFKMWFEPTKMIACENSHLVVEVPSKIVGDWLNEQYCSKIEEAMETVLGKKLSIVYKVKSNGEENGASAFPDKIGQENVEASINIPRYSFLNPNFTFENFVIGPSNQFVAAAALAVSDNLQCRYNPLFIYGGTGLGKTHLLHAIGNNFTRKFPDQKLLYCTSERFVNDMINYVRNNRMDEFHRIYRNVDILLIDDIQFISGKERTQEEFFHTFNALYHANKKIVISSDQPPCAIPTLEERLRSRFEWGIIADIKPPELETKVAIIFKKAEILELAISESLALFIAENVKTNIRKIEGCLAKLKAYSSIYNTPPSITLAQRCLREFFDYQEGQITLEAIKSRVCEYYRISPSELRSKNRKKEVLDARQMGMYLARTLGNFTYQDIGREFGNRDHSTVIHAIAKVNSLSKRNPAIKKAIETLQEEIRKEGIKTDFPQVYHD